MAGSKTSSNFKLFIFIFCSFAFSPLANQISSQKHLNTWANQKTGHPLRSSGQSGHPGIYQWNASISVNNPQNNFSKPTRHPHQTHEVVKRQNSVKEAIQLSSSSSSSSAISSSSSPSSTLFGKNTSNESSRHFQYDQPQLVGHVNSASDCKYPCQCAPSSATPHCKAGVNTVIDGCGCCTQCGRQMGDLCNFKDKCDEQKSLFCDFKLDGGFRGYCRARNPRACNISGKTITDGQQYQPNCSLLCTCQDGKYACSSLCPQELRPPSPIYCKDAQLVPVKNSCCKEWVCPNPHNYPSHEETMSSQYPNEKACNKEVTEWSMCSVSCGVGESIRVTSDNEECQARQERRLCIVRPCGPMGEHTDADITTLKQLAVDQHQQTRNKEASHHSKKPDSSKKFSKNGVKSSGSNGGNKCRATLENRTWEKIHYEECSSDNMYQLRYCSSCRKCCGPEKTRTEEIKFVCPEGKTLMKPFMFIEKCVCYKAKNCPFS